MTDRPVPLRRLRLLGASELVAEYDRLMVGRHDYTGGSNPAQRQKRIDWVVDLLSGLADAGDETALAWFDAAR